MVKKKILLLVILFSFAVILFQACTRSDKKEQCSEDDGIWYREICIKEDSTESELKQAGLLKESKAELFEIRIKYPYQIIRYPDIQNKLDVIVDNMESETGIKKVDKVNSTASYPWQLNIDADNFKKAGDLASILVYVMSYTGGAHPNHYYESVNFNTGSQKIITLEELFDDSEYIYRISEYVTSKLLEQKSRKTGKDIETDEWIERGSLPLGSNFEIFVFIPDDKENKVNAIKFIFPPYTVGPYAEGKYEVKVPADVFYKYLDNSYQNSFVKPGSQG